MYVYTIVQDLPLDLSIPLFDEVGTGMAVAAVGYQLPHQLDVGLVDLLWIGQHLGHMDRNCNLQVRQRQECK